MHLTLLMLWAAASADPFLDWLDAIAQKQLAAREAVVSAIRDPAQAAARQEFVRAKILSLIGGLPDYNGPLNAQVTGQIQQAGYVIEKVVFDSLPGISVTGNLYRPSQAGKYPGVLLPLGHWEYGKPAVQRIAGNLALKGFVVLTYDPYGQGERQQLFDRRLGASLADHATEQHLLAGGLSALLGQSFARYRIWDAKRALDYLVSRPEVLADKIGCTGCSGGGTITTYISALDRRIKVAAPACYMNSFRELFTGPVGDSEQSIPGFVEAGLDLPDWVELGAPKPWLILSTEGDFFPLAGAKRAFEEAGRVYEAFDARAKLRWVVGPGGHGTPLNVREAIYGWMIQWLKDGQGSATEQPVGLLPDHALWATPTGQVSELAGSRDLFDELKRQFEKTNSPSRFGDSLKKWIYEPKDDSWPVRAELVLPPVLSKTNPAVILVDTTGKVPERARELAKFGNIVVVVTPRGLPLGTNPRGYSGDWLPNVRAWLIGRNLPAMRARDILHGFVLLKSRADVDPDRITAEAAGMAGVWLMMAASVEPGIGHVTVTRTPYSFAKAFENGLTRDLHSAVIPGFSLMGDLPDLVSPGRISWIDPVDWLGHVVPMRATNISYSPSAQ